MDGDCPSARIFEAAAASSVIISDELPFTQKHFGDSVLYVDTTQSAEEMFRTIDGHVKWILSHPQEAQELARRSHQIFCEKFALEDFLARDVLDLYESVTQGRAMPGSKVMED
jgi:spore maturation protein CgeB